MSRPDQESRGEKRKRALPPEKKKNGASVEVPYQLMVIWELLQRKETRRVAVFLLILSISGVGLESLMLLEKNTEKQRVTQQITEANNLLRKMRVTDFKDKEGVQWSEEFHTWWSEHPYSLQILLSEISLGDNTSINNGELEHAIFYTKDSLYRMDDALQTFSLQLQDPLLDQIGIDGGVEVTRQTINDLQKNVQQSIEELNAIQGKLYVTQASTEEIAQAAMKLQEEISSVSDQLPAYFNVFDNLSTAIDNLKIVQEFLKTSLKLGVDVSHLLMLLGSLLAVIASHMGLLVHLRGKKSEEIRLVVDSNTQDLGRRRATGGDKVELARRVNTILRSDRPDTIKPRAGRGVRTATGRGGSAVQENYRGLTREQHLEGHLEEARRNQGNS